MPLVLTADALIVCSHLGTIQPGAGQQALTADGAQVLVAADLAGVPVSGCQQPVSSTTKPCTTVISVLAGPAATLRAGGQPALLATASGATDSVPPGTWSVQSAGQTTLHAS